MCLAFCLRDQAHTSPPCRQARSFWSRSLFTEDSVKTLISMKPHHLSLGPTLLGGLETHFDSVFLSPVDLASQPQVVLCCITLINAQSPSAEDSFCWWYLTYNSIPIGHPAFSPPEEKWGRGKVSFLYFRVATSARHSFL